MAHAFRQVTLGRFYDEMEMVPHTYVYEEDYIVYLKGKCELIEEYRQIFLVRKYAAPLVTSAGNMIICTGILDSQRPRHAPIVPQGGEMSRIKI